MTTLTQDFQAVENWVVNLFATLKHDVAVAEADIIKVFQFIQPYGTQIASGIAGALTIAAAAGVGIPAPVIVAAGALNSAVQVVNQAVAAQQAAAAAGQGTGNQTVALLSTAYQGLKTAQISLAQGQSQLAATPTPAQ